MSDVIKEARARPDVLRWVVAAVAALAIVALLAWARRDPGFDDRIPDPEDAALIVDGIAVSRVAEGV
jgi:hypothetical protein